MATYYCDNLIRRWRRDWFEAESDEEAIQLAEEGIYDVKDSEDLYECDEYVKTEDGQHYVFELFNDKHKIIKRYDQ